MREADYPAFVALLDSTCNLLSRGQHTPSAMQAAMWFRSLAEFDIADVRAAFDAHIRDPQRGRFVPLPADILAQLHGAAADDTRPGADEAWAIALRAMGIASISGSINNRGLGLPQGTVRPLGVVGCSSSGTVDSPTMIYSRDQAISTFGHGPLVEALCFLLRWAGGWCRG
jgi:hypothetical protein